MESTGEKGRIQISQETADLLAAADKSQWLSPRETRVDAKGKGLMQTYWLTIEGDQSSDGQSIESFETSTYVSDVEFTTPGAANADPKQAQIASAKTSRLIQWNVDVLHRLLKQIVARRNALVREHPNRKADADESQFRNNNGRMMVLDEVEEIIALPAYNFSREAAEQANSIELDPAVMDQLHDYVSAVATLYNDNPFHNFEQ